MSSGESSEIKEVQPFRLTSDNLLGYLTGYDQDGGRIPQLDAESFPRILDLRSVRKSLYELDSAKTTFKEQEKARSLYFSLDKNNTDSTEIIFGTEKYRVPATEQLLDLFFQGNIPMIGVHTHPNVGMLSPEDYTPLLLDRGGAPLCRAVMVIDPSIQVLAIATKDTPRFSNIDSLHQYIKSFLKDYHSLEMLVSKAQTGLIEQQLKEIKERRIVQRLQERITQIRTGIHPSLDRFNRLVSSTEKTSAEIVEPMRNQELISTAKNMNVVLYSSFNYGAFFKWSA